MSYKELDILLLKEQTNRTTEGTALDETNFSMVGTDFEFLMKQDPNKIPFALGQFGKYKDLPGKASVEFKGKSYLSVNGINEPMFSKLLKASGFVMSRITGTTTANTTISDATVTPAVMTGIEAGTVCSFSAGFPLTTQVYVVSSVDVSTIEMDTPASSTQTGVTMVFYKRQRRWAPSCDYANWTYLTGWKYAGIKGSSASKLTKGYSMLCDATISGEIGKPIELEFIGKCCLSAVPADATYPTGTLTPPSDTICTMLKASAAAFAGQTYSILKFSVANKNSVELVKSGTGTYGYKYADINNSDIEVKLTVYQNSNDPHASLVAGTIGTFDIACGDTLLGARIYSPNSKFEITDISEGEDGKINTWEITGKITENDLYIETGAA